MLTYLSNVEMVMQIQFHDTLSSFLELLLLHEETDDSKKLLIDTRVIQHETLGYKIKMCQIVPNPQVESGKLDVFIQIIEHRFPLIFDPTFEVSEQSERQASGFGSSKILTIFNHEEGSEERVVG
jgi:hypothetical protein